MRSLIRRLLFLAGSLVLVAPLALPQTSTWIPDKAHSEVAFSVLHMNLSMVRGRFGNIGGSVVLDEADITKSTVNIMIDVSSVDTGVGPRDADLKSDHFFDVAQYPTAIFTTTSVAKSGAGLIVAGKLTLHGVTKPVVLNVDAPRGPLASMDKKPHYGFTATTTLKRSDFGIGPKYPDAMIGDDIKLSIDLDVAKQ